MNVLNSAGAVYIAGAATFRHLAIANSNIEQTTGSVITDLSSAGGDYVIAHSRISGGYGLYSNASGSRKIRALGDTFDSATIIYAGNGNPTFVVQSDGANQLVGTSPAWFKYDGSTPPTTVYGFDIQCDVTKMSRVTGEYCRNTNASPGSGTLTTAGPVMDQGTSSNSWFLRSNPSGQTY